MFSDECKIITESLKNSGVLSELRIIESFQERNSETGIEEIWTLNVVEIDDDNIGNIAAKLDKLMKSGYYAHFTNYKELIVVFRGKHFRLHNKKVTKEDKTGAESFEADPRDLKIWKSALKYGTTKGKVDLRYIIDVV